MNPIIICTHKTWEKILKKFRGYASQKGILHKLSQNKMHSNGHYIIFTMAQLILLFFSFTYPH
jgi:hypothetical protein